MIRNNISNYIKSLFPLSDYFLFGTITLVIFLIWAIFVKSVLSGDSLSYIYHAEEVLGKRSNFDSGIRGPVYYYLLAGIMSLFKNSNWLEIVVCFQYLLLWLSGLFIFKIILIALSEKIFAWIAGLFNALCLSSINYGSMIITESLSLFLFVLLIFIIIRKNQPPGLKYIFMAGVLASILVLTRFNMISLLLWVFGFFLYCHFFLRGSNYLYISKSLIVFLIPVILSLFLWSYRNNSKFGFFSPFIPNYNTISVNALYSFIDEGTKISPEYQVYKNIVLESKETIITNSLTRNQGSLSAFPYIANIAKLNYGFNIRNNSYGKFINCTKNCKYINKKYY